MYTVAHLEVTCTYTHDIKCTHMHAYMHKDEHNTCTYMHIHVHAYIHTHMHTCTKEAHAFMHLHGHISMSCIMHRSITPWVCTCTNVMGMKDLAIAATANAAIQQNDSAWQRYSEQDENVSTGAKQRNNGQQYVHSSP